MKKYILLLFVSLGFTSLSAQNYKMKVTKTNGEMIEIAADAIQDITFETTQSPQEPDRFITVAGIKWATGNLQYDEGKWKIADHQWDYFKTHQAKPISMKYRKPKIRSTISIMAFAAKTH